jgi:hypothetical protein
MSDLTSGHNVARNVYLLPAFNNLCGFQEADIAAALQQIVAACELPEQRAAEALEIMRTFYNGHCFSPGEERLVYNPTLVHHDDPFRSDLCASSHPTARWIPTCTTMRRERR